MLKNMSTLKTLPRIMNSAVFQRFFQLTSYAKLTKEERTMYDISLKPKWDAEAARMYQEGLEEQLKAATKAAEKAVLVAKAEVEHKKAIELALNMLNKGYKKEEVSDILGLTIEEVENLK